MKILHLDTRPDWRGGQQQILLTLRGLRSRGHYAALMARRDSPLAHRAAAEGFPVRTVSSRWVRPAAVFGLRELLAREPFDVVHAQDPHALTAAWLAGAHRRAVLVASRRVAYPLSRSRLGLARYRASRSILAVSRFVADSVVDSGVDARRVDVVRDGVELPPDFTAAARREARARWGASEEDLLLGCVGYLLPEKGQEALLRSLPAIREQFPSCRLLLAGDGPCRRRLERLAGENGLQAAVIFAGFIEDVESVYRALDIFLFPSLAEPLGSSLLAAMAHSLPVVAVERGGVPEIVEHGRNGLLVPSPRGEVFAAAALRLLRNREEAARLGAAARETIVQRFTAERLVEGTLESYRSALERKAAE